MDLTRLRHILAVARTGSFSRAAEEERITQPALSRSIAAFERHYEMVLFDRGRSGAKPTAAGLAVIEQARKLLSSSQDFEQSLRLHAKGQMGRIALGLGPLLASLLLPQLGSKFLRLYPGLDVQALISTPDQLLPALFDGRIELIVGNNLNLGYIPGATRRNLVSLPLEVIVRRAHPLASVKTVSVADLATYPTASGVGLPPGDWSPAVGSFVCENYHILRDIVLQTDSIWPTSPALVESELNNGELVRLLVTDAEPICSDICIVSRRGRTLSSAATLIAGEIETMLRAIARQYHPSCESDGPSRS